MTLGLNGTSVDGGVVCLDLLEEAVGVDAFELVRELLERVAL